MELPKLRSGKHASAGNVNLPRYSCDLSPLAGHEGAVSPVSFIYRKSQNLEMHGGGDLTAGGSDASVLNAMNIISS
jgi:hypothetical protein